MSIRYEKGYEMYSGHILTESEAQLLNDAENLCSLTINSRASINARQNLFQIIALQDVKYT